MSNVNEIAVALAQLQESLKGIESAKKQVSIVVESYGKTSNNMSSYAQNLSKLHLDINNLIESEKNTASEIGNSIEVVKSKCDSIVANHKKVANEIISEANGVIIKLQEKFALDCNTAIETFGANASKTTEENLKIVKKSISAIDESIAELREVIEGVSAIRREINMAMKPIEVVLEKIQVLSDANEMSFKSVLTNTSNTLTCINKFANNQDINNKELLSIHKESMAILDDIRKENSSLKMNMSKFQHSNKIMFSITITLLVAIIILFFVK